jgi:hypothetical protein
MVKLGLHLVKLDFGQNMNIDPRLFCSLNMSKMFLSHKSHNSITYEQKSPQGALKQHYENYWNIVLHGLIRHVACVAWSCFKVWCHTSHYYKSSTHIPSLANNTCMYSTCTQHECCRCFNAMFQWQCTWNDGAHVHVMLIWCTDARQTPRVLQGTCQLLRRSLVSWSSKKQNSVALSTAEAEYILARSCCA